MEGVIFEVYISRLSLYATGLWPGINESRLSKFISDVVLVVSLFSISYFVVIPQTMKLFLMDNNLDEIVDILCVADIPIFVSVVKIVLLRYNFKAVKCLILKMCENWKAAHTDKQNMRMRESAKKGRRLVTICIGLAYSTTNSFFFMRLLLLRKKRSLTNKRELLLQSYFPFDVSNSPWFEIIWILQALSTLSSTTSYSGIDSFFAAVLMHLCGQLVILKDDLNDLTTEGNKIDYRDKVTRIVNRHMELNKFAKTMEDVFNKMFLAQVIGCAVQFCLQGYQIVSILMNQSVELPLLYLTFMSIYMTYLLVDLYLHCYVAEKLRVKSTELSEAAYNCQWYCLKSKEAQDLIFIMKRAQYPLEITVGKFCSLSLSLFASIGKTSLGYLSMLLAVKDRRVGD